MELVLASQVVGSKLGGKWRVEELLQLLNFNLKGTLLILSLKEDPWQSGRQLQNSALCMARDCLKLIRKEYMASV